MKNITIWENKNRRKALSEYKNMFEKYFTIVEYNQFDREIIDSPNSQKLREYLNHKNLYIERILKEAGFNIVVRYTPPPVIGGYIQNINLFDNMFQLQKFDIDITSITDIIEQAIGAYEQDFKQSVIRTLNPFYWVGKIINIFATIPFYIFAGMGYDQKKLEKSTLGVTIKVILRIIGFLISIAVTVSAIWVLLASLKIVPAEYSYTKILELFQHFKF